MIVALMITALTLTGCIQEWVADTVSIYWDLAPYTSYIWVSEVHLQPGSYSAECLIDPVSTNGVWFSPTVKTPYSSIPIDSIDNSTSVGFSLYDRSYTTVLLQVKSSNVIVASKFMEKIALVKFKLTDEAAGVAIRSAYIAGDFNNWGKVEDITPYKLQKDDNNVWYVKVPLRSGIYKYKFVVNPTSWNSSNGFTGGIWIYDKGNPKREDESDDAASVIEVEIN